MICLGAGRQRQQCRLGVREALLSALAHFFEKERWGSLAEVSAPGQCLTAAVTDLKLV